MKNDNHSAKHAKNSSSKDNSAEPRRKPRENFKVTLSEEDLAVGADYVAKTDDSINESYDLANFAPHNTDADNAASADNPAPKTRSDKFNPQSQEINSFSNNSAKNHAMRNSKEELKQQKKEFKRRRKEKDKNNRNIFRLFWLIACIVVGIFLGQYMLVGFNDLLAVQRTEGSVVTIELAQNPDVDAVADILEKNGVINSKTYFKLFTKLTKKDDDFKQGTFEIAKNLDYQAIVSFLQSNSNRSDIVTVQFPEGLNVVEIADKLLENGVITDKEAFLSLCNTDDFDEQFTFLKGSENNEKYYKLEGYLYPDTYDFYINEDLKSVLEKMINNYENRVYYNTRRVSGYDKKIAIGKLMRESEYTSDEIMIIASIIQAEALNVEDMYNISSVLHNRLKADESLGVMSLGCDSTIYYPYRSKDSVPAELAGYVSRYDTYTVIGLPAGEICNPGADAILAALMPNDTDYIYFCHSAETEDEPAQAYYASSYSEHEYNLYLAGLTDDE